MDGNSDVLIEGILELITRSVMRIVLDPVTCRMPLADARFLLHRHVGCSWLWKGMEVGVLGIQA